MYLCRVATCEALVANHCLLKGQQGGWSTSCNALTSSGLNPCRASASAEPMSWAAPVSPISSTTRSRNCSACLDAAVSAVGVIASALQAAVAATTGSLSLRIGKLGKGAPEPLALERSATVVSAPEAACPLRGATALFNGAANRGTAARTDGKALCVNFLTLFHNLLKTLTLELLPSSADAPSAPARAPTAAATAAAAAGFFVFFFACAFPQELWAGSARGILQLRPAPLENLGYLCDRTCNQHLRDTCLTRKTCKVLV